MSGQSLVPEAIFLFVLFIKTPMLKEENCPLSLVGSRAEWRGIFLKALVVYDDAGFETWEGRRRRDGRSAGLSTGQSAGQLPVSSLNHVGSVCRPVI